MSEIAQDTRGAALYTPLEDELTLLEMQGHEQLGRLFQYTVTALSPDAEIDPDTLLGQNATIRLETVDSDTRYFNGYISSIRTLPSTDRMARYEFILHPWLWFLTRTSDCRIFQEQTVPDIIKEVFRDHGFTDFEDKLNDTYRQWTYCVQYRETDFDFVSRLMEHEGIYYYFKHQNGKHVMVMADKYGSHSTIPGYEEVPYFPPAANALRERDHIWGWSQTANLQPTAYEVNSFNFEKPGNSLRARRNVSRDHDGAKYEIYEYTGNYGETNEGDSYANTRLESLSANYKVTEGTGNARGLTCGALFTLSNYPIESQNVEYIVTGATYQLHSDAFEVGADIASQQFVCSIDAIDAKTTFRPERRTPKPEIRGPQSAVVVGKKGEEIWTDKYGRVKVKFHWDRYSKADENSSCWIRVSHPSAGKNWGAIAIPRIGQEVLVEFLEGDPDRPIITGLVYNGENMPPYKLPDHKTKSTTKTNSSIGGKGFNEIRFEDEKGEEQVFVHAEKDLHTRVKNDRMEWIGNDQHLLIKADKFEEVEANRNETIGSNHREEIGKDRNLTVNGKQAIKVAQSHSVTVEDDVSEAFKKNHSHIVDKDYYVKATNICVEATENITIKVGESYIAIDSNGIKISTTGDIVVDAKKNLTQKAGMNAKLEAGMNLNAKAGINADVKSSAMLNLKSGLIKIN